MPIACCADALQSRIGTSLWQHFQTAIRADFIIGPLTDSADFACGYGEKLGSGLGVRCEAVLGLHCAAKQQDHQGETNSHSHHATPVFVNHTPIQIVLALARCQTGPLDPLFVVLDGAAE